MVTYIFYRMIIVCMLSSLISKKRNKENMKEKKDIGESVQKKDVLLNANYARVKK